MLELLRIRNLALIEDMELEFTPGMNALTGETGAGKSFILRAIEFLTGEKMSRDLVRPGKDKASVEALFILDGEDCIIRRELAADTGRSRLYVNDRLSSQEAVRALKPRLVVHTSQHGQQKLLQPAYQARILDAHLPDQTLLDAREQALTDLRNVLAEKEALARKSEELEKQREFLEFQHAEIKKVGPEPGEEDDLLVRKKVLQSKEQAGECLDAALNLLAGEITLGDIVADLQRELERVSDIFPDFEDDRQTVEEFRHVLSDIEMRLRRRPKFDDDCDDDLDSIEARLYELSKLRRKLGRSLEEIVDLGREIEENLSFLDVCGLDRQRLDKREAELAGALARAVDALNAARREAAGELCEALQAELRDLGFSEAVRVEYHFDEYELYHGEAATVTDLKARLYWIPNPGQPPQPIDRIASGGELSRFLLALVSIRNHGDPEHLPTLIFDEVDAGIGGLTLNSVGDKLSALAGRQQMLLITHWPQLAGRAERHFQVRKDVEDGRTTTTCVRLEGADIRNELARMAGGGEKGEALAGKLLEG